jgi:[ribosomal protein S5]-alanine N-acetyltransferase
MRKKETLETERLILRPLSPADFEAVHSWTSVPENVRYMSWGSNTEEDTRTYLELAAQMAGNDFAIVLKDTGQVIGSGGIFADAAGDTGELGWILHRDYWQRGYGTELAAELIRYAFEDLGLRRIETPCAAVNYGSYRVMERNGMRREALKKQAMWGRVDNEWIDRAEYAILADEWREHQQFHQANAGQGLVAA